ncbi:24847_t:CDS:2, partial [Gigaspora margarita]
SSYPNLKRLNLWDNQIITDKGLCKIMQMCNKLEYLNISYCRAYWITDKTISHILNSFINLQSLDIAFSHGEIKDADMLIQVYLKIEYLDFASVMAFRNDSLIVAIIRSSPNLKHFNISGNDIEDKVVEAIASTCHELEYIDHGGCGFITEPSICNVIHSCPKLQYRELGFCDISDTTIKEIAHSCLNLKYLNLEADSRSSDTSGSDPNDNIQSKNIHSLIPDPLRVSRSTIFTSGSNRMVSTNTLNITDLISAIRVTLVLTDSE